MLYALLFICTTLLVFVSAVQISRASQSRFELNRRAEGGDSDSQRVLQREVHVADLLSLQRVVLALLIVAITLLSVAAYGMLSGIAIACLIILFHGVLTRLWPVRRFAQARYDSLEPRLIGWVQKVPYVFTLLRSVAMESVTDPTLQSKEQLLDLVDTSRGILTNEQKSLLHHGLAFGDVLVSEIMTPRSVIDSVAAPELLGPLVLDDLHKTGHSRFPVVEGDIDHIVGMLHLRDLLVIDASRRSQPVRKAMEARVFYIKDTQRLSHALASFLSSHHHLFVVVNDYRETVGLLSLEDVIEQLLGRRIIDEFDTHEDLRAVAARNPRANNHPEKRTDV